jgi:hypothetical protein
MAAVDARGKERTESIRKQLADRADDEINQDFPLTCFRERRLNLAASGRRVPEHCGSQKR